MTLVSPIPWQYELLGIVMLALFAIALVRAIHILGPGVMGR